MEVQHQLLLTYNDFAVHCYTRGCFEEALLLLNKALKADKNEKGLYVNRGGNRAAPGLGWAGLAWAVGGASEADQLISKCVVSWKHPSGVGECGQGWAEWCSDTIWAWRTHRRWCGGGLEQNSPGKPSWRPLLAGCSCGWQAAFPSRVCVREGRCRLLWGLGVRTSGFHPCPCHRFPEGGVVSLLLCSPMPMSLALNMMALVEAPGGRDSVCEVLWKQEGLHSCKVVAAVNDPSLTDLS